jgi:Ca-activated chloride channel homolog
MPFALFLSALAVLSVGMARPVSIVRVPVVQTTVILAMDVSRSMCSVDIPPNRLEAAKTAARSFIQQQPSGLQIGIVAFAGFAEVVQPPTTDKSSLENAIKGLTTGRRTAIGSAIQRSVEAIDEVNNGGPGGENSLPNTGQGGYAPDIIVLLTDGASNTGPFPLHAAFEAAERGIRVYTIGFGTEQGGDMICFGEPFFGGGGGGFYLEIDEPTLIQIAEMTGGEYFQATSAHELENVFRELPSTLITREEITEISVAFAALGALLAALAIGLAMAWQPLI